MSEETEALLAKAIQHYGADGQITVAIEEMAELTKELCKTKRGEMDLDHIAEEISDVGIMIEQLKIIFACPDKIARCRRYKLRRLAQRIYEDEQNGRKEGG